MKFDTFDRLDHRLLHALQLDGRAALSRIAEVLSVSDQTVARRYRKLCTAANVRVLGAVDVGIVEQESWILRLQVASGAAERLADTLGQRPDTAYISLISGGTEISCAMHPRGASNRAEPLLEQLRRAPQIRSITAHCVLHSFYGSALGWVAKTDALDADEVTALSPPTPAATGPVRLDAIDDALLSVLQRDGRAPLGELRSVAGITESAVRRRIDALRRSGALYFEVQHDPAAFGFHTQAMLWLTVAPSALHDVGTALAGHPEVAFAAAITGQANLAVDAVFRNTADLYRYLTARIGALPGILATETSLVLRATKQLTYEPRSGAHAHAHHRI